jgi:hypothetical protein
MPIDETEATVTLVHPIYLLAEPEFGSTVRMLLEGGASLSVRRAEAGFLYIQTNGAVAGYVPAAACAPLAAGAAAGTLAATHVIQPVWLYRHPAPGSQFAAPWIVSPDETLMVIGREFQFIRVKRQNGQIGYIPELACGTIVAAGGPYPTTRLRQPVALYGTPAPGGQLSAEWIILPEETLLVLGGEQGFLLVQRDDGRLGFVPAALCGQPIPDQLFKAGPLDLGWIAIGGSWMCVNWIAVGGMLRQANLVGPALTPYIGVILLMGVVGCLWFGSRRRYVARSFAVGILLAYALLHFVSRGTLTLWS